MAWFRRASQSGEGNISSYNIFSKEIMYEPLISGEGDHSATSSSSQSSAVIGRCQRNRRLLTLVFIFGGFSLIYLISLHSNARSVRSMSEHLLLSSPFLLKSPLQSSSLLDSLPLDFRLLLSPPNQSHLFLLEPQLLSELAAQQQPDFNAEDFRWRFSLPPAFRYRANSLTVGIFAEDVPKVNLSSLNWTEQKRLTGAYGPFNQSSTSSNLQFLQHAFYQKTITSKLNSTLPKNTTTLHLHLVVLFPVRQLLWIGAIDEDTLFTLNDGDEENPARTTVVHYGRTAEEIFDPFKTAVLKTGSKRSQPQSILVPDDISHLLSQLPTARYLHCDPAKTAAWFTQYNQTENAGKVEASRRAISRMKSLMRRMRMQFWAVCGTLLGWYRQCTVTPYTTDTDFASWAKYVRAEAAEQEEVNRNDKKSKKLLSLTELLKAEAAHHQLYLLNRFGEPWHSLEYSFATTGDRWEKADLFFVYPNRSHFLLPFHVPPQYAYSIYPRYGLCSGELLGFKVQVPCTPLEVIIAEYGAEWQTPVSSWSYYEAPKNIGPLLPFAFANVSQHESFSE